MIKIWCLSQGYRKWTRPWKSQGQSGTRGWCGIVFASFAKKTLPPFLTYLLIRVTRGTLSDDDSYIQCYSFNVCAYKNGWPMKKLLYGVFNEKTMGTSERLSCFCLPERSWIFSWRLSTEKWRGFVTRPYRCDCNNSNSRFIKLLPTFIVFLHLTLCKLLTIKSRYLCGQTGKSVGIPQRALGRRFDPR